MIWTQGPRSPYLFTLCPFITYKTVALPVTTREHRAAIPRLHRAGARVRRLPRHGCVLTSEVKACGVELVRVPLAVPRLAVPCPSCEASRSSQSASQPLSQRHPSVFTCVSRPAGSPPARRRGFKRDAPLRPHTERRKVRLWALMTLYLHVTRMISVLQHFSPPSLPLHLLSLSNVQPSICHRFSEFLQEAFHTAQRAAARLYRR